MLHSGYPAVSPMRQSKLPSIPFIGQGVRRKNFIFIRMGFPVTFRAGSHSYVRNHGLRRNVPDEWPAPTPIADLSAPTPTRSK